MVIVQYCFDIGMACIIVIIKFFKANNHVSLKFGVCIILVSVSRFYVHVCDPVNCISKFTTRSMHAQNHMHALTSREVI